MRILMISFGFPPANSIGCVRTGKIAKYLTRFGHEVRVISARHQVDMQSALRLEMPRECITYTPWLNFRWPLEIMLGRGKRLEDAWEATYSNHLGLGRNILRVLRTFLYFPDKEIGWMPFALHSASHMLRRWSPTLIYASAGPYTSLIVAHLLSQRFGVPWIGELRDLWVNNHNYKYFGYPAWRERLEEKLERRVLSSAEGLVTVSVPLAQTLIKKHRKPTAVILNGFDASDYPAGSDIRFNDNVFRIVYTGNIYFNSQSPEPLFEALQMLGNLAQRVRVSFFGNFSKRLHEMARGCGIEHLIEIIGPVSHQDALKAQKQADFLLHLLWNDPDEPGVYGAKLFEYLGSRRPVLAVGHTDNVAAQLIIERGAGVAANDPKELAIHLENRIKYKETNGQIPQLDGKVGLGLSREEQTRQLERFLIELLARKSPQLMSMSCFQGPYVC